MRDETSTPTADPFVPETLDATRWESLAPLYDALLARPIEDADALEQWLLDRSELDAASSEGQASLYINMTCHTDDEGVAGAWTTYLEEVSPHLKNVSFEMDKRQVSCFETLGIESERYQVLDRDTRVDVDLFREENVTLETQIAKLDQEYDAIRGAQTVDFDGQTRTLPQMARFLQENDRALRERAWRAVSDRTLADTERVDAIYDEMVSLRNRCAANAGYENFRDYAFRAKRRFDYTPADCERFHDAIERHCVPFARRLDERRREALGVASLRPWDTAVDEQGRAPLRPFEGGAELVERSRKVFDALHPELSALFRSLGENEEPGGCLDLDSRKGKAPGGYQYMRDRMRRPFIFMNAAGLHRDVETMVHEAGHAFHSLWCVDEPLLHYRDAPIEFAEVASMTMELLTMPHWGEFYPDAQSLARAQRKQLEGTIALLPWIAAIDAFQHWVYLHPDHTRDGRTECWLALDARFGKSIAWDGLENARATQWQRQGHLFGAAFYYIEYAIAQLGALGIWCNAQRDGVGPALDAYKRGLSLGGSRPLPELFASAGMPLDFGADRVASLVDAVESALEQLPE